MFDINEELKAAKAAKAAIDFLLTATPKSAVLATVNKAKYAAQARRGRAASATHRFQVPWQS
jgi:hypothetical protein